MLAGQDEFTLLVMESCEQDDHTGGALSDQFDDLEYRIERIAGEYRPEKFGRLLDEPDERIRYLVRKPTGAGRREAQDLQPMRQRAGKAARSAEFQVIVDRMVVPGHDLKRREAGIRHGAARQRVTLADRELLEPTLRRNRVPRRIESLVCHAGSPLSPVRTRADRSAISHVHACPPPRRAVWKSDTSRESPRRSSAARRQSRAGDRRSPRDI